MPRPTRTPRFPASALGPILLLTVPLGIGCSSSAPPPSSDPDTSSASAGSGTAESEVSGGGQGLEVRPADPADLTTIPLMTEIDGIEIPRLASAGDFGREIGGPIPVDEFNPDATGDATPTVGGTLNVRFPAEPKTLNPITDSSAYQQYIGSYIQDGLFYRDAETFEWRPSMASDCVKEDSVKLRADFPGYERTLDVGEGEPVASRNVVIDDDPEAEVETITVVDGDGNPVPRGWVGLYKDGDDAPTAHLFADEEGVVRLSYDPGDYTAKPGAELFGVLGEADTDGSRTLTPSSPGNDLKEPLELAAGDVADVQRQTVYTFSLREDVTWSDGEPFTARDLRFAYAVINSLFVDGDSLRTYYADVVRVEEIDPFTCRIQYRTQYFLAFEFAAGLAAYAPPYHYFEKVFAEQGREMTLDRLTPGQEDAAGKISVHGQRFGKFFNTNETYNRKPLGVGPYVVADWEDGVKVVLRRRDDYVNPDPSLRTYLGTINFKFIADDITALQAVRGGDVDFNIQVLPEQYFNELERPSEKEWFDRDYVKAEWVVPSFRYVGWNMRRPMFQDRRVRVALRMLFDVEDFFEKKLNGAGILVSGPQCAFGPAYDEDVLPIGVDASAARDLLADAGWIDTDGDNRLDKDGEPFAFTLLMPAGKDDYRDRSAIMQRRFKDAGIEMKVQELEWASFLDRIQGKDFDASALGWVSSLESDPYQIWHSSGAAPELRSSNAVSFRNEYADRLIETARLTLDDEKRYALMHAFHRLLDAEQPYMFLYNESELGVYAKKFRGVRFFPIRPGFDLREWYIPEDLR